MEKLTKQQIKHYIIINLSYNLTHKLLKEKIYSQVIRNITEYIIFMNHINAKHLLKALIKHVNKYNRLYHLLNNFLWYKVPEGFDYWNNLQRKYFYENY